jgi:hypothetical protein
VEFLNKQNSLSKKNGTTKLFTVTLILLLTLPVIAVSIPATTAHDPPWTIETWSYVGVVPENVGVNQEMLIVFWPAEYPYTAQGAYGDRFTWNIEITKPNGEIDRMGPFISDPVGGSWTLYTPTQVGTYTVVAKMDEHTYTGLPDTTPSTIRSPEFVNDTALASQSDPVQFTVQEDPVAGYEETPLPDGYWTRPIYGANRNWYSVAGNWVGGAAQTNGTTTNFGYGLAPESAHVLWTRPFWSGGIMDTRTGSISYYTGLSYESYGAPNIIMEGKIYYTVEQPPREGFYCVDLYSGETVWFRNTTGAVTDTSGTGSFDNSGEIPYGDFAFGQIYNYDSPNQHGGFPYLWVTDTGKSRTWDMYDAYSGNYICSIANVSSSGTSVYGKDGSILYYNIAGSGANKRLTVWNTSRAIWYEPFFTSNYYWMWRPDLNSTFDGNNGFSLNVSVPNVSGSIMSVREGQYIIGGNAGKKNSTYTEQGNLWALSLEEGHEGQLLWETTFTPPETVDDQEIIRTPGYRDVSMGLVDPEDGVFFFEMPLSRERWCYSLTTGQLMWKSEPEAQFNFYGMSDFIYNGRLYSYGYSGELIAYDIPTGTVDWVWSAPDEGLGETFYQKTPLSLGCIADGKAYMYTSEHSPSVPLRRDANIWCVDLETGELMWKMSSWSTGTLVADERLVSYNLFDNAMYCFGKGPSATTVEVQDNVISAGEQIMITGTVTDQTPSGRLNTNGEVDFALAGTPAIADEDQEAWMEYLFQQRPMPEDAKGVTVKLTAIDPNCNTQVIGEVTSDMWGNYGMSWTPPVEGEYLIMAEFEGSKSYGSSSDSTYIVVGEAAAPVAQATATPNPAEPTLAPSTTTPQAPVSPSPSQAPQPTASMPTTTYVAVAVAVVIVAVAVAVLVLRRRK